MGGKDPEEARALPLDPALRERFGHINGNREANALISAAWIGVHRRVDSYGLPSQVHKGAPAVARIDRSIRLDEVLEGKDPQVGPLERADDAGGHRLGETEGVSKGKDPLPDAN